MAKRNRRHFTDEFKADVVKLITKGGRQLTDVVRELDLTESSVRRWVEQAHVDAGQGPPEALTTSEKQELATLRHEVKVLRMERDLLKKATAFFAKDHA